MLGHVATSAGGALPGSGSNGSMLLGQRLLLSPGSFTVPVPGDGFAFSEVIGHGGSSSNVSGSGGGAGSDAIFAVAAGSDVTVSVPNTLLAGGTPSPCTVSYGGTVRATGNSANSGEQTAASGKYPGTNGFFRQGGNGGGRLGGLGMSPTYTTPGAGAGAQNDSGSGLQRGGSALACLTFFTTYDAALAFAKSVYGGTWTP